MITFNKQIALSDEIRIGFESVKYGLKKFQELKGMPSEYYIPFLLLGNGLERIMKVLICFNEFEKNSQFPNSAKLKNLSHSLTNLLNEIIVVCEQYPLYTHATARMNEINFVKNDLDFKAIINMISDFLVSGRYYNLNIITDCDYKSCSSPEEILMKFRSDYCKRNSEIQEIAMQNDWIEFYKVLNSFFLENLQRFIKFLAFCFTQGAFGNLARQYSTGLLNEFLVINEEDLSKLNF